MFIFIGKTLTRSPVRGRSMRPRFVYRRAQTPVSRSYEETEQESSEEDQVEADEVDSVYPDLSSQGAGANLKTLALNPNPPDRSRSFVRNKASLLSFYKRKPLLSLRIITLQPVQSEKGKSSKKKRENDRTIEKRNHAHSCRIESRNHRFY